LRKRKPGVSRSRNIVVLTGDHDRASLTPDPLTTTGVARRGALAVGVDRCLDTLQAGALLGECRA